MIIVQSIVSLPCLSRTCMSECIKSIYFPSHYLFFKQVPFHICTATKFLRISGLNGYEGTLLTVAFWLVYLTAWIIDFMLNPHLDRTSKDVAYFVCEVQFDRPLQAPGHLLKRIRPDLIHSFARGFRHLVTSGLEYNSLFEY